MLIRAFVNGKIYVSFNPKRTVEALLVAFGRVLYAGSKEKVKKIVQELGGEIIDLQGKVVLPGFIDSHMHLDELGMSLNMVDLRGVRSIEELKERIREHAKKSGTWVLGHGWDQELFEEKRWPTRWDLDDVIKDKPVMLSRVCLHAAVLNTKAMEMSGLLDLDSPGIMRNEEGEPTGVVKEEAFELAREKFKETLTLEDYKRFIEDGAKFALSNGVTTVGFVSVEESSMKALGELNAEGRLPIRVRAYLDPGRRSRNMYGNTDILQALKKLGIRRGSGGEKLKINGIKILADGSLGARTAWLSKPYSDAQTEGYPNIGRKTLETIVKEAHEAGLQVAVHAIGDATMDMILDVYEHLENAERHRIEHASILREDQIERISKLGAVLAVQPHFIITDWWVLERVGEERAKWVYPFKSVLKKGIVLGLSTDAPVEPLNPWETIYAAVTRGKYEEVPLYKHSPNEALTLEEALHAYTYGSAYILGEESTLGTLEEGKLADFIVVDRDPFKVEKKELREIRVLETYVGGFKAE